MYSCISLYEGIIKNIYVYIYIYVFVYVYMQGQLQKHVKCCLYVYIYIYTHIYVFAYRCVSIYYRHRVPTGALAHVLGLPEAGN